MPGLLGDVVNAVTIAGVSAYLGGIVAHATGHFDLTRVFGRHWAEDGFCVSFKGTPFNTHLLCFYCDVLAATALLLLVVCRRGDGSKGAGVTGSAGAASDGRPAAWLVVVRAGVLSTFMHGVAHLFVWYLQPPSSNGTLTQEIGDTPWKQAVTVAMLTLFFYSFVKTSWPNRKAFVALQALTLAMVALYYVPLLYGFTFVNTVIFVNGCGSALLKSKEEKDRLYDLAAVCLMLPPLVMTWAEPLLCDSFLVNWGGHLWFDLSIPASLMVYYAVASSMTLEAKKKV